MLRHHVWRPQRVTRTNLARNMWSHVLYDHPSLFICGAVSDQKSGSALGVDWLKTLVRLDKHNFSCAGRTVYSPDNYGHPLLCTSIRNITSEEASRIYAFEKSKLLFQFVENGIFCGFQANWKKENVGLKYASFYFVETCPNQSGSSRCTMPHVLS